MYCTETALLPLLRERQGSGTSTAEERVIGAGLQALEKNEDGAAVKRLFHMFAVTQVRAIYSLIDALARIPHDTLHAFGSRHHQEDFVHPMAVVLMLWRSCCASESEKQERSLTSQLKVRQWAQMLVDHSLLLGSSLEGIHLHDIGD